MADLVMGAGFVGSREFHALLHASRMGVDRAHVFL
jgi:hypothetical protein